MVCSGESRPAYADKNLREVSVKVVNVLLAELPYSAASEVSE